ncbi:ABC transporter permease [Rathayibacter sp. AY1B7]|uniref:carbohydrate ABC transporter permease n=1 Tax=unclassified Rathayibacter TaxID=2609250 RepID=UPI000CE72DD6|nr:MULTISPECIES: sugar ABC transporter permease [unclassified Rathayibacter]PPF13097.1 ABC transporter permease [Rathayibacter sp. AY1A5]PPF48738.1 ABC transporter permease [Rathayibacter sp. AY1A1]PPG51440.1 ABC transporter permease [Rathayibacter sp. AY2B3]PPG85632.1 ABC transporter permease [Rathayibacter sp. AY1H2]PPH01085.1 ABC transporter permease [Rathayibacter sp. AY1G9]
MAPPPLTLPTAPPRRGRLGTGFRARVLAPYAMLAPAIVLFAAFMAAPILYTVMLSFQKKQAVGLGLGSGGRKQVFAGIENYLGSLSDPEFGASVGRVLLYGLVLIPCMLGLALLFALLLDARRARAVSFSRVSIFLPYAVPAVISSLLWGFLYLPAVSPFAYVIERLGGEAPDILSSGAVVFGIANIALWGGVGFNMIVIHTALQAIPSDVYEAARIDGASDLQIALRIKIPIVTPALVMTALFSMVATLQVFAEPTTLRPLTNSLSTSWSPLMLVYRDAFTRDDIHSAAATSVVIALASFAVSFLFLRVVQKRAFGQED